MANGVISTETPNGSRTDYLFRVSLKAYIKNERGEVLVVKESGRTEWDLPGGGMDHGESVRDALVRELKEEVGYMGDFTYRPIAVDNPHILPALNAYQIRIIISVTPKQLDFSGGVDSDQIKFVNPEEFIDSIAPPELKIVEYTQLINPI